MLVTLGTLPPPVSGLGDVGHIMVVFAAYQDLTTPAKARANALVRKNPKDWVKWLPTGTSKAAKDIMLFMIAATWPDQIKGDSYYQSDGSHEGIGILRTLARVPGANLDLVPRGPAA